MFDLRHAPPDAKCVDLGWNTAIHRPQLYLSREGLGLFTTEGASIGQEQTIKGRIAPGRNGNLAVFNTDYLTVPEEQKQEVVAMTRRVIIMPVE
jgi:predicted amidohydrolase YtcJ